MSEYVEVHFNLESQNDREIINYHLSAKGVESIVEDDDFILAYFEIEKWENVADFFQLWNHEVRGIKNENWNAIWEASFEPVLINDFCYVRAPFHPKLEREEIIDLILEPKMAFGTAHHETTYMMMSEMEKVSFEDKKVFDFGCGTAILSILAEKLGAASIYAIDIEEIAIENAIYNCEINQCRRIKCEVKILEQVDPAVYDIILANINRGVLLSSANDLHVCLNNSGILLLSGILLEDEEMIIRTYQKAGFQHLETIYKGEWKCLKFTTS